MSCQVIDAEQEKMKRELRLRIGRLRRRINSRVRSSRRAGRRLMSWQTYVKRYPGHALVAALGFGLAVSAGFAGGRAWRWIGLRLARRTLRKAGHQIWRELGRIWDDSSPVKNPTPTSGADNDRA